LRSSKAYSLVYTGDFRRHLTSIDRKYHPLIRETLKMQLQYEPNVQTRNRKPLRRPLSFRAEWELRFGPGNRYRAFYAVKELEVILLAFGEKEGNRLLIEGREVGP
jgi:hypothetical protein